MKRTVSLILFIQHYKVVCAALCLVTKWHCSYNLLNSEVISRQASIVDVEDQTGIVNGGIKHLEQ